MISSRFLWLFRTFRPKGHWNLRVPPNGDNLEMNCKTFFGRWRSGIYSTQWRNWTIWKNQKIQNTFNSEKTQINDLLWNTASNFPSGHFTLPTRSTDKEQHTCGRRSCYYIGQPVGERRLVLGKFWFTWTFVKPVERIVLEKSNVKLRNHFEKIV